MNKIKSISGEILNPDNIAIPCGKRLFRFPEGKLML